MTPKFKDGGFVYCIQTTRGQLCGVPENNIKLNEFL